MSASWSKPATPPRNYFVPNFGVDKDFKMTASITKNLKKLRKMYELPDAVLVLSFYLPDLQVNLYLSNL